MSAICLGRFWIELIDKPLRGFGGWGTVYPRLKPGATFESSLRDGGGALTDSLNMVYSESQNLELYHSSEGILFSCFCKIK